MGLDAMVGCNCLVRGLAKPPPVPVHIGDDGWLVPIDERDWEVFESWRVDCCAHPEMEYTSVHVGNWSMYRSFQQALGEVGWAHFPTLQRVLPNANGGEVSPVDARACLDELAEFRRVYRQARPVLIDSKSGETIFDHIAAYDGIFMMSGAGGFNLGFNHDGLFIVPAGTRAVVFQALRVEQRPDASGGTELVDLDTGFSWVIPRPLAASDGLSAHPRVEVVQRTFTAKDHQYTLDALETAFRAAAEIGSPVHWC